MAKIGKGPKVGADGKKDWTGYYAGMKDKELVEHAAATLGNCPMTYLKLLGAALKQRIVKLVK